MTILFDYRIEDKRSFAERSGAKFGRAIAESFILCYTLPIGTRNAKYSEESADETLIS